MAMKEIKRIKWSLDEANDYFKLNLDKRYWEFIVQQLNYKEISYNPKLNALFFPSYIPVKDIIGEILKEIDKGSISVIKCQICEYYFDINKEEGIFGDPQNMERFICSPCSQNLSAKDFYEIHLKI